MAAITLSAPPTIKRSTCSATPNNVQQVTVEGRERYIVIYAPTAELKLALSGTDGAAIGSDYITIPVGASYTVPWRLDRGRKDGSFYLASATAAAPFEIHTIEGQDP